MHAGFSVCVCVCCWRSHRRQLSRGTHLLLQLLHSLRTYVHPSNTGGWSDKIALLTAWLCCALARRIGALHSATTGTSSNAADTSTGGAVTSGTTATSADGIKAGAAVASNSGALLIRAQAVQRVERAGSVLTPEDAAAVVASVLPLLQEMLFAKHPTAVDSAERALRILAGILAVPP